MLAAHTNYKNCSASTAIICTGCKKTITSQIHRIPTRYERILPMVQFLRPEATMKSSFCADCLQKILNRWEKSRQKRQVGILSMSTMQSNTMVSSSGNSHISEDSIDKMISVARDSPNWRIDANSQLNTRLQNLDSSSSSSSSFFQQNSEQNSEQPHLQDNIIPSSESQQTLQQSPEIYEDIIEILPTEEVVVTSEIINENISPTEEVDLRIESSSESSDVSDNIPLALIKKPRVRIRRRIDDPPDPNIDINFHQRFNGG